jgi:hypothetical protein
MKDRRIFYLNQQITSNLQHKWTIEELATKVTFLKTIYKNCSKKKQVYHQFNFCEICV